MISETENPQEAKCVCPSKPVRHAKADPGRYFMQSPHCWFSCNSAHTLLSSQINPSNVGLCVYSVSSVHSVVIQ